MLKNIIRFQYRGLLKENKCLRRSTQRLQQRIRTLKGLVSHLRQKNLVSENALLHLKVHDIVA